MKFVVLPLLLLAACTAHEKNGGAFKDDTTLAVTAVAPETDTSARARIWFAIDGSAATRRGGQTGGGHDVFTTTSGHYAAAAQLITLEDKTGNNVGQLRGGRADRTIG